jgi:dipeptidyl aminopeptidase/acylaminoacyl peptidase
MGHQVKAYYTNIVVANVFSIKSGVKGKAEGYSALLKIDAKGRNIADVLTQLKLGKGAKPTTLNVKAMVPNYLDAKLAQSISLKEGNTDLSIKWIPTGRRIAATSQLSSQGDTYNLDADFKWDADRDDSKAVTLKSVTTLSTSAWRIDSK